MRGRARGLSAVLVLVVAAPPALADQGNIVGAMIEKAFVALVLAGLGVAALVRVIQWWSRRQ